VKRLRPYLLIIVLLSVGLHIIQANDYVGKIDDSFTVTPLGQVNYEIAIPVVSGTGGLTPKLSIVYDSSRKFGLLGYGFDLSGLSIISRKAPDRFNDGVAGYVNFTESDHFSLDGSRLVIIDSLSGSYEYKTETNNFSKILSYGSRIDPDSFIVRTKAGLIYKYESNTDLLGYSGETGLFWMLTKVKDTMGNYFTVSYQGNTGNSGPLVDNTIYPTRIDYTGNEASSLAPYASVRFSYITEPIPQITYIYGKLVVREKSINRIEVYSGDSLERAFRIDYTVVDQMRQVSQITEIAADGTEKRPTSFDWSSISVSDISKSTSNSSQISKATITVGDFNGDGMSDFIATPKDKNAGWSQKEWRLFLSQNGTPTFHSNGRFFFDDEIRQVVSGDFNGDGYDDFAILRFYQYDGSSPVHYTTAFYLSHQDNGEFYFQDAGYTYYSGSPYSIQVIEHNGDGRADLFLYFPNTRQYKTLISTGSGYQTLQTGYLPTGTLEKIDYVDVNGDGLTDILLLYPNACYLLSSNGNGGYTYLDWDVNTISSNYTTLPGDFNGDGKTDLLITSWNNTTWGYWYVYMSTGDGDFLTKSFSPLCQTNEYQLFVGDINGDGFDDLYAIKKVTGNQPQTSPLVFLNDGTGSFSSRSMSVTSNATDKCNVYLGDFNGDGKTDIVTTSDWIHTHDNGFQLFLTPAQNSNLLSRITDGLGNSTNISYKYLSDSIAHHRGSAASYPLTSFSASWPVVYQVSSPNGIGGTFVNTYTYRNALIHRNGRGVLGFEHVNVKDEISNTTTDTEYEINTTKYVLNQKRSITTINGHTVSESIIYNGLQDYGNGVYTCMPDSVREKTYEYNTGILTSENRTSYQYDIYGNPTQVISTNGNVTTTTSNTYINDTQKWYIGRLSQSDVMKSCPTGTKARHARFDYDANSGLLSAEYTEPGNSTYGIKKEYIRDMFGNIITSTSIPNNTAYTPRSQSTQYDVKGRYMVSETDALGHTVLNTINQNNGLLQNTTDANGITTTYSYDSFGRQTGSSMPISAMTTTMGWSHGMADAPAHSLYYRSSQVTGEPEKKEFYDCLGRTVRTVTTNADNQKVYTDMVYNNKGLVEKISEPYFPGNVVFWNTTNYDACGRPVMKTDGAGHSTHFNYNGLETTITDALGHVTVRTTDINGNLTQVEDHEGNTIDYLYDVDGHCIRLTGPRTVTMMAYDIMGNRIQLNDPDLGFVESSYNAYGELVSQTDSKGSTTYLYDSGGRLVKETRPDVTITSTYDDDFIGALSHIASSNNRSISYSHDAYGRTIQQTNTITGRVFVTSTTYNAQNKVDSLVYPSGFTIRNIYSANGYLWKIINASSQTVLWQMESQNARGQITQETLGNGLVRNTLYNDSTGWLTGISTPGIQNWNYTYDAIGNLLSRKDVAKNLTESFLYDALGRLVCVKKNGHVTQQMTYDAAGNILSKTGVGRDFLYEDDTNRLLSFQPDSLLPQIWPHIHYTSFNKVDSIVRGNDYLYLLYGPDKSRCKSVMRKNSVIETKYYAGSLYEETVKSGVTTQTCYIFAGGKAVAIYETSTSSGNRTLYLHHDHLGSVQAYSDENGNLLQELSYDAWGRRRNPVTWEYYSSIYEADAINPWGFTGHEHIDIFEMVNMDGRMYDPFIGRFLSPDPFVQAPDITQGLNRYTYCLNNPLSLVDPTGYSWLSDNWRSLVASVVGIAVSAVTAGAGVSLGIAVLAGVAGGAAGALTGALLNGSNIGQIAKATFTGAFWGGVSAFFNFASADDELFAKLFKHTISQGWLEGVQGGNMFHGMMMGAVSSAGGHYIDKYASSMGRFGEISANAILSGTVDELGGGKFANGAITGAFSIMFNDMMHPKDDNVKIVNIDKETIPHSELLEVAAVSTMAGAVLLSDDITGGGVFDDPIAGVCFVVADAAATAYTIVTTVNALKEFYHVMKAEHTRNARPSTADKHTKTRSGKSYGQNRNQNRGNKNKKHEHPINPNKKRK